jgi:hypothetical protein
MVLSFTGVQERDLIFSLSLKYKMPLHESSAFLLFGNHFRNNPFPQAKDSQVNKFCGRHNPPW